MLNELALGRAEAAGCISSYLGIKAVQYYVPAPLSAKAGIL
jgi:hypothetical protein